MAHHSKTMPLRFTQNRGGFFFVPKVTAQGKSGMLQGTGNSAYACFRKSRTGFSHKNTSTAARAKPGEGIAP